MKRTAPLALALLLGLCSCTTPVSQLKLPEESAEDLSSGVLVEEITEETHEPIDGIAGLYPPMIAFAAASRGETWLLGSLEDPGAEFVEENGFSTGAGTMNTYQLDDAGEIRPDHMIAPTVAGQKNLLQFACQGVGFVRIKAVKDDAVIAEDSLRCGIPANKLSMEFTVPDGGEIWIVQEPSADTRGIHEVMFYS